MKDEFPYKYETHCHTSEVSACASSTASEIIQSYARKGYSGIIITDHFFNGNCNINPALPWEEKVDLFCLGYENAHKAANKLDIDVFFGWEYTYKGTDFLTYGLDKRFLLDNPDLLEWPLDLYFKKVHEAGGFLIHAHPFRERSYIDKIRLFGTKIDGIEVINSGNDKKIYNQKALAYAEEFGLLQTAGSDTHNADNLSGEGTYFPVKLNSIHEFIKSVKNGECYISLESLMQEESIYNEPKLKCYKIDQIFSGIGITCKNDQVVMPEGGIDLVLIANAEYIADIKFIDIEVKGRQIKNNLSANS